MAATDMMFRMGFDGKQVEHGMKGVEAQAGFLQKSLQSFGNRFLSSFIAIFSLEKAFQIGQRVLEIARNAEQLAQQFNITRQEAAALQELADEMGISFQELVQNGRDIGEALRFAADRDPLFSEREIDSINVVSDLAQELGRITKDLGLGFAMGAFGGEGRGLAGKVGSFVSGTTVMGAGARGIKAGFDRFAREDNGEFNRLGKIALKLAGVVGGLGGLSAKEILDPDSITRERANRQAEFLTEQQLKTIRLRIEKEKEIQSMIGKSDAEQLEILKKGLDKLKEGAKSIELGIKTQKRIEEEGFLDATGIQKVRNKLRRLRLEQAENEEDQQKRQTLIQRAEERLRKQEESSNKEEKAKSLKKGTIATDSLVGIGNFLGSMGARVQEEQLMVQRRSHAELVRIAQTLQLQNMRGELTGALMFPIT